MSSTLAPFKEIRTRVTGVSSGLDAETRQLALEIIRESLIPKERWFLDLVPQWDNEYDSDAIQVMTEVPGMGRVQIGFIKNPETICDFCHHQHTSYPKEGKCSGCGRGKDSLRRNGLASQISQLMREDPTANYYGEILEVTGGEGAKANFGCNIVIKKQWKKK
jgi:hypothetical protein